MTMLGPREPHPFLFHLHDTLTGWQDIRERRRPRHAPPSSAASPPPASMYTAPVSGTPSAAGPAGREPKAATVIAFHKIGDRLVPIFGDPAEVAEAAPRASTGAGSEPTAGPATQAPEPTAPPAASPEPATDPKAPPCPQPPPPDFTPQSVEASAPRRTPSAPPTLDLPPPTPPSLARAEEAVTLERVLAEHRAQLAQHAVMMEAILAEHRRVQAQADEARGQQLADHRRAQAEADQEHRLQLAELLTRHRDEVQAAAVAGGEQAQAVASLRELLAQQADAMQAEHVRVGDKLESIVDIVGIVGETVHHIAAAALQPRMPRFSAPPPPLAEAKPTPPPSEQAPPPAATCVPRILPARPAASSPSSAVQPTSPTNTPHVEPQPTSQPPDAQSTIASAVPPTRGQARTTPAPTTSPSPDSGNVPAVTRGESDPGPGPAGSTHTPLHAAPKNTAVNASTAPRSLGLTPVSTILTLVNTEFTVPLTPRQRRAQEEARERSRLHDAVSSIPDDDPMFDEDSETGDAAEGEVSRG